MEDMKKRLLEKLLTLIIILIPGTTWADGTVDKWDGNTLTEPTETEVIGGKTFYKITKAAHWAWLYINWQNGSKNVRLYTDLDMGGDGENGYVFTSIIGGSSQSVSGIIDGNNHTIYNISVNKANQWETGGIVGYLASGTIKDISIVNGYVYSSNNGTYGTGGIAGGYGSGSTLENCSFQGQVVTPNANNVGGIVGKPAANSWNIINCHFDGTVVGHDYVGTIVGNNSSGATLTGNDYSETSTIVVDGIAISGEGIDVGKAASSYTAYNITKASMENGSVTVAVGGGTATKAAAGTVITVTAEPEENYEVVSVTIAKSNGDEVSVTSTSENVYTFTMPASDVVVSATFNSSKTDAVITTPPAAKTLTYTGGAQELVKAGVATGGTMQYSSNGTDYNADIPMGTDAGTYTIYYKVIGDANHYDVDPATLQVTIAKAALADAVITLTSDNADDYDYDDAEVSPAISVTLNGLTLTKDVDYTIIYANNDAVGTGSVSITGNGNYQGTSASTPFDITRKLVLNTAYDYLTYYAAEDLQLPSGYEAMTVSSASLADQAVSTSSVSYLPKETPIILHKTGTAQGTYHLKAATTTGSAPSVFSGFKGSLSDTDVSSLSGTVYILVAGEFVELDKTEGGNIPANRCYLQFEEASHAPARLLIGGTTNIQTMTSARSEDATYYDLHGRRLQGRPTQKGIYIVNGKKTIIK